MNTTNGLDKEVSLHLRFPTWYMLGLDYCATSLCSKFFLGLDLRVRTKSEKNYSEEAERLS